MRSFWADATDDRRLLRLAALGLAGAVWLLSMAAPRKAGLTAAFVLPFTLLVLAVALVDLTAPPARAALWRRLLWLAVELVLCYEIVKLQGTLIRPTLIYLLPASQALLLFGTRWGLLLGLSAWLAYLVNIWAGAVPHRLGDFPNYLSFFLAPYVVAVVLTLAALRQAEDRRRLQALYDELRAAHVELQELHRRARQAAVSEERNRLAREIHDTLAHYLTIANVQLEAAEKLADEQPARALDLVRRARRLTVACLQEVRRSVRALRAASLEELALAGALRRLCSEFAGNTGIAVQAEIDLPDDAVLPPEAALALFRAAQEGLTNVQRHARAATAILSVGRGDGRLTLVLQDDGVGPADGAERAGGFGLLGLHERLALIGGHLRFGRGPQGGGRLEVDLPDPDGAGGRPAALPAGEPVEDDTPRAQPIAGARAGR
ncbi:MAG TPA: sensor histidine kinase [Dehalococcoidia bacterium]|nr:sensor histidine kinase [Dehalococcoidia bacterium]